MPLSLVIADNADGSGGAATIAGSDIGSANSLFCAGFGGATGPLSWIAAGARTGDGAIAVASPGSVPLGYYMWHAMGTVGGTAAFASYFRALTDASAQSVMDRVLTAVVQQIQALNLSGIQSINIVRKWLRRKLETAGQVPQIQVVPVAIIAIDKQNQDYTANQTRNLLWRQQLLRAFRFQRLSGVDEIINCVPGQQSIVDKAAFDANLFVTLVTLRFISREPRGVAGGS
jgi:hypothetical protein